MSSVLSTAGTLGRSARTRSWREWRPRVFAACAALWREAFSGERSAAWPESASAYGGLAFSRVPGDVLAGQPGVVIPLARAVVCGEDHVYDAAQFAVCPNCAAEERLSLVDLLGRGRRTAIRISR